MSNQRPVCQYINKLNIRPHKAVYRDYLKTFFYSIASYNNSKYGPFKKGLKSNFYNVFFFFLENQTLTCLKSPDMFISPVDLFKNDAYTDLCIKAIIYIA